jgi:hypothetical protein
MKTLEACSLNSETVEQDFLDQAEPAFARGNFTASKSQPFSQQPQANILIFARNFRADCSLSHKIAGSAPRRTCPASNTPQDCSLFRYRLPMH